MASSKELIGTFTIDLTKSSSSITVDLASTELASRELQVNSEQAFENAAALVAVCAKRAEQVASFWEHDRDLAHQLHRSITGKISALQAPWIKIRASLEAKMKAWRTAQERERQKREQEERQRADEERRKVEEQARALKMAGEYGLAKQVVQEAETAIAPSSVQPFAPKSESVTEKWPWIGEVNDLMALIKAIAEGTVPLEYEIKGEMRPLLNVDQNVLNHLARTRQGDFSIPGCSAKQDLRFSRKAGV